MISYHLRTKPMDLPNIWANRLDSLIFLVFQRNAASSMTAHGGKRATVQEVQRSEDSAKWTFYEAYEKLCKRVGVQPAAMP